jgi:DNA transposition AAA+ family ATPase
VLELDNIQKSVEIPFIVTKQVKEVASVCTALIESRDMGVIYGEPGVGKSITAAQITENWTKKGSLKVICTEADVGSTPLGIAKKLISLITDLVPGNSAQAARIIENISNKHHFDLIIVDEAERLNQKCLEMLRSIYDRTKIPVLLIGMTDLLRHLRSHKKFYSRVSMVYHYEPLSYPQLSEYLGQLHPLLKDIDPVLEKELLDYIYQHSRGEFRRIIQMVKQAERIRRANQHPVLSISVFKAASDLILKV